MVSTYAELATEAYVTVNAWTRLCQVRDIDPPMVLDELRTALLVRLVERTGQTQSDLEQALHYPTSDKVRQLKAKFNSRPADEIITALADDLGLDDPA